PTRRSSDLLGASGEHLAHPTDLGIATDHRVELAALGDLGGVDAVLLESALRLLLAGGCALHVRHGSPSRLELRWLNFSAMARRMHEPGRIDPERMPPADEGCRKCVRCTHRERADERTTMSYLSTFWDFLWSMFWIFAFVAYLFAIFSIIGDLFRDHRLAGWAKALWIIFLIFVPFLTALAYLIVRGRGMAERNAAAAAEARRATDDYIRQAAGGSPSAADEIQKAKALLDSGAISTSEYEALKAKALR